jgi:transcriptional regulator with PAS, ATPase and Fis domain
MINESWLKEFNGAVTVCDKEGIILKMNDKAIITFEKYGGTKLIGTNLLDCHPEPSKTKLKEMLISGKPNAYTIEKNGIKKLIYQAPWFEEKRYMGFIELSLEIPFEMPHFVRK